MIAILRLSLILCLALTSVALGAARGTVSIGGEMVLCTGEGVVVVRGADGQPDGRAHICPDMALAMLAVNAVLPDLPAAPVLNARKMQSDPRDTAMRSNGQPPAAARDPPGMTV